MDENVETVSKKRHKKVLGEGFRGAAFCTAIK
jgi:hypothetical protein